VFQVFGDRIAIRTFHTQTTRTPNAPTLKHLKYETPMRGLGSVASRIMVQLARVSTSLLNGPVQIRESTWPL